MATGPFFKNGIQQKAPPETCLSNEEMFTISGKHFLDNLDYFVVAHRTVAREWQTARSSAEENRNCK